MNLTKQVYLEEKLFSCVGFRSNYTVDACDNQQEFDRSSLASLPRKLPVFELLVFIVCVSHLFIWYEQNILMESSNEKKTIWFYLYQVFFRNFCISIFSELLISSNFSNFMYFYFFSWILYIFLMKLKLWFRLSFLIVFSIEHLQNKYSIFLYNDWLWINFFSQVLEHSK